MLTDNNLGICLMIIFFIVNQISGIGVSYNQPKFCPNATWNPNGITFADENTIGLRPSGIFVNINNTVYVTANSLNQIQVFVEGSIVPTRSISDNLINPRSLFVTVDDSIYVDNGNNNNSRVDMWTSNAVTSVPAMYVSSSCFGLFVDINNFLYCSLENSHRVIKNSLNNNSSTPIVVAGTGIGGASSAMLYRPSGIFVDINFDLYVADTGNNRIQLYQFGQVNGITIIGNEAPVGVILNYPTGVVLDADRYLFIVDQGNRRIIGSGPNGFRCLVGCSGTIGSASNQLAYPYSLSFDSYGNIFVTDMNNNRIQKFILASNSCDSQTMETTSTSAMSTTKTLTTKIYIWTNSTSTANNYSYNYYFISFLFFFNYIIML